MTPLAILEAIIELVPDAAKAFDALYEAFKRDGTEADEVKAARAAAELAVDAEEAAVVK